MHRGYTKRWRKRWDKGYHKDLELWLMMDYFIDFANHKDSEVFLPHYGNVKLKRGEHLFGVPSMSRYLGISQKKIRKRLKILEKCEFMAIKRTNRFSIGSIINYDIYNPLEPDEGNQVGTSREQAGNKQGTKRATPNNVKNDKELKETYRWLDIERWKSFRKMRSRIRKPMTAKAEEMGLKKLKGLIDEGYDQAELLDTAESKCWLEVYPPKNKDPEQTTKLYLSDEEKLERYRKSKK